MADIATGLFSLGGVVLGAILSPLTQLYLERQREKRAGHKARLVVAGELLHIQLNLRTASKTKNRLIFYAEDINSFLPNSAWLENKSILVATAPADLWDELVMMYAILGSERALLISASRLPGINLATPLVTAEEAEHFKLNAAKVGRLRRKLSGGGGSWPDEITGLE